MDVPARKIEDIIKEIGSKLKGNINMPILVGGWAINLMGHARQTLDVDFMIDEADYKSTETILNQLGYYESCKTPMFSRFEFKSGTDSSLPVIDCLFAEKETYLKIKKTGTVTNLFGMDFLLPSPINIIAMKLHALKYSPDRSRPHDFEDVLALIEINSLDIGKNSEFEKVCLKYGTENILKDIREVLKPKQEEKKEIKFKL